MNVISTFNKIQCVEEYLNKDNTHAEFTDDLIQQRGTLFARTLKQLELIRLLLLREFFCNQPVFSEWKFKLAR